MLHKVKPDRLSVSSGETSVNMMTPPSPSPFDSAESDRELGSLADNGTGLDETLIPSEELIEESVPTDTTEPGELDAPPVLDFCLEGTGNRERALPFRQGDLTRLLINEPGLTAEDRLQLAEFGRFLAATFHAEFHGKLIELKERYASLDPDSEYTHLGEHSITLTDDSDESFLAPFEEVIRRANYRALDIKVIEQAVSAPNEMGLTYIPDFSLFEHLRVYVRGYTKITRDCRSLKTKYLKRKVTLDAYQRLVVALKFKPGLKLGPFVRSDVLYLRMYKDVPHVDMEMHLPEQGTKVRMRWIDKAQIASPLVMGIPTLIAKALFASLVSPVALGGLIIAPISAGVNSFFGYQRSRQKHLYEMIYRLYYLPLANNASVITRLIDSAEDEEYKEAMLAYFILWRAQVTRDTSSWTEARLDETIETFLKEKTGVQIDFEVVDAFNKLQNLGLATIDAKGNLSVIPIDRALAALDSRWDNVFRYT